MKYRFKKDGDPSKLQQFFSWLNADDCTGSFMRVQNIARCRHLGLFLAACAFVVLVIVNLGQ